MLLFCEEEDWHQNASTVQQFWEKQKKHAFTRPQLDLGCMELLPEELREHVDVFDVQLRA
jgi:hypothetical protein